MSPKVFNWMLRGKNRKIVLSPLTGPGGGSYILELREGVTVVGKKTVSRLSVERYISNLLRIDVENLVKAADAKAEEDEEDDDDDSD